MRRLVATLAAVAILGAAWVHADEPMPKPAKVTVHSPNNKSYAFSEPDPTVPTTTVFEDASKAKLWSMKGWYRSFWLADDGEHLVVGYPGLNLLSQKHAKDEALVWFYEKGELVAKGTLDQIVADEAHLEKTVSHYHWGMGKGFDEKGRFVIETVERKEVVFDVTTGKIVETRDVKKK